MIKVSKKWSCPSFDDGQILLKISAMPFRNQIPFWMLMLLFTTPTYRNNTLKEGFYVRWKVWGLQTCNVNFFVALNSTSWLNSLKAFDKWFTNKVIILIESDWKKKNWANFCQFFGFEKLNFSCTITHKNLWLRCCRFF